MAVPRFRVTERQVLMLLLVASFIGFGGAFLVAGFRQHGERLERTGEPRVRWMPARELTGAAPAEYLVAEYFDPSLMSLPNAHGFSARMWRARAGMPPRTFEPPVELALLDPTLPRELPTLLTEAPLADTVQSVVKQLPATTEDIFNDTEPVAAVTTQSTVLIEGSLEQRGLSRRPELPVVSAEAGLKPTRIRVAVASDGRIRYAMLDRSCGNETIDSLALQIAHGLRFEPTISPDPLALTWGAVKFYWATTPTQ
jgi:hypothetical protein